MNTMCASRAYKMPVSITIQRVLVAWRAMKALHCSRCPRTIHAGELFTRGSHMRPVCRRCTRFGAWPDDQQEHTQEVAS